MGQVVFDTQEFVETLEKDGLPRNQAKAISLVVRQSHEVADLATKRDLDYVRKDLSNDIADVKRDITDVRKEIADVRKDIAAGFDKISMQMTIRLGLMVAAAVSIIAAILKM